MKIHKITLHKQNLFHRNGESQVVIFDNKDNNKNRINIFIMPNKSGKSLVYNALESLIAFNKKSFIKNTDKDLSVKIEFSIDGEEYLFESSYSHPYKVWKNDVEVTDFEIILRRELGLNLGRMEYFGNNRNSLHSISRFICLNFEGIKSKDESNKIPLINADHDGRSRRLLLAYVLGANISNEHFKIITEIEYKEDFIKNHRKEFEKINTKAQEISGIDSSLNKLFGELEEGRMVLGDISIAIRELDNLIIKYTSLKGNQTEDYYFLLGEKESLLKSKSEIEKDIKNIREEIRNSQVVESKSLGKTKKENIELLENLKKYEQYKSDLEKIDRMSLDSYEANTIDPIITELRIFLNKLYRMFIKKAGELEILSQDDGILNISFDEKDFQIEAYFRTSEGSRKAIRILTFIGLQLFMKNNLRNSFYDSCLENIDPNNRKALFETIMDFIEQENIKLPNMFIFITQTQEKDQDDFSDLVSGHLSNFNFIQTSGLHQL